MLKDGKAAELKNKNQDRVLHDGIYHSITSGKAGGLR